MKEGRKMRYCIENCGCDDTTFATIDLTNQERDIFIKICEKLNSESTYGCQPVIEMYKIIEEVNDEEGYFDFFKSKLDENNLIKGRIKEDD